ncbi:MAG: cyclic nucleotide-binding domain-containing protein [Phycisphaerae bacterium]|nr:cyclic nucleotide-binding domain-containing protein [Phycisphaerae bacterium]
MAKDKTHELLLDIENVLPMLNKIAIFAGLTEKQLYMIFRLLTKVTYKKDESVFEQGDKPTHIYIVKSGKIKLVVWREHTPLELAEFQEGDCFGEASVIGIQPHEGAAVASADSEIIVLSRKALLSVYDTDKELFSILILNIAREIARRLYKSDQTLLHYTV